MKTLRLHIEQLLPQEQLAQGGTVTFGCKGIDELS
jgi:hypothetical protein